MDVTECYLPADTLMMFKWCMIVRDEHIHFIDCARQRASALFSLRFNTKHFYTSFLLPSLPVPDPRADWSVSLENPHEQKKKETFKKLSFKNWRSWKDYKCTVIFHFWPAFDIHCLFSLSSRCTSLLFLAVSLLTWAN